MILNNNNEKGDFYLKQKKKLEYFTKNETLLSLNVSSCDKTTVRDTCRRVWFRSTASFFTFWVTLWGFVFPAASWCLPKKWDERKGRWKGAWRVGLPEWSDEDVKDEDSGDRKTLGWAAGTSTKKEKKYKLKIVNVCRWKVMTWQHQSCENPRLN